MRRALPTSLFALLLIGCGDKSRPTGLPMDADFPEQPSEVRDGVSEASSTMDAPRDGAHAEGGGDAPVSDSHGDSFDAPDAPDTPHARDALIDATLDALGDGADAATSALCGFTETQLNRLAVRIGGCTAEPAQTVMERFWRPETWEGQGVHARDCGALRCAASATDCPTAMFDCLKYGVAALGDAGACSAIASCEGDGRRVLTRCDGQRRFTDDCEATARVCVASATEATCVASGAEGCAEGSRARCAGGDYQQCIAGRFASVQRCGATGSLCVASSGAGGCTGTGASCSGAESRCDGTRVARCRNGHMQSLTCSDLVTNSNCRVVASHVFCGVAGECDPRASATLARCEGTTLVLCAGGRSYRYDCMAEGFRGCGPAGCTL